MYRQPPPVTNELEGTERNEMNPSFVLSGHFAKLEVFPWRTVHSIGVYICLSINSPIEQRIKAKSACKFLLRPSRASEHPRWQREPPGQTTANIGGADLMLKNSEGDSWTDVVVHTRGAFSLLFTSLVNSQRLLFVFALEKLCPITSFGVRMPACTCSSSIGH